MSEREFLSYHNKSNMSISHSVGLSVCLSLEGEDEGDEDDAAEEGEVGKAPGSPVAHVVTRGSSDRVGARAAASAT